MTRLTIMGATIVLLLAAFVLTPAEAYHKRHRQQHHHAYSHHQAPDHFVLNQSERRARYQHTYSARRTVAHRTDSCTMTNEGRRVCMGAASQSARAAVPAVPVVDGIGNRAYAVADGAQIIGTRPSGCPHQYCGCGLRKYLGIVGVRPKQIAHERELAAKEKETVEAK